MFSKINIFRAKMADINPRRLCMSNREQYLTQITDAIENTRDPAIAVAVQSVSSLGVLLPFQAEEFLVDGRVASFLGAAGGGTAAEVHQ